jgi:hypothetical protein
MFRRKKKSNKMEVLKERKRKKEKSKEKSRFQIELSGTLLI